MYKLYIHFVHVSTWGTLSLLIYVTTIHIVARRDRIVTYCARVNGLCHCSASPHRPSVLTVCSWQQARDQWDCASRTKRVGDNTPMAAASYCCTWYCQLLLEHAGKARIIAALVGFLRRNACVEAGARLDTLYRILAITWNVRHALRKHPETSPKGEV